MTDDASLPIDHEPLNRAERRAQRYRPNAGQPDPHAVGGGPVPDETPTEGGGGESFAESGSGDVTRLTGAGTGGATESDGRVAHHEGVHLGNQPNS
ncbi:MAG TPA: hypothetical protein VKB30_06275 [Candidatus Limnocylindrales bacterium]|nr:hypothetical protein [Candidatus Limnocylindrales bacterium]